MSTRIGTKMVVVVLLLVALVVFPQGSKAMSLCNMDDQGLMACKPSVTPPPPDPVDPSSDCCDALKGADLKCLCSYKNSFLLPSLGIDPDLALALPPKCNLTLPPDCWGRSYIATPQMHKQFIFEIFHENVHVKHKICCIILVIFVCILHWGLLLFLLFNLRDRLTNND